MRNDTDDTNSHFTSFSLELTIGPYKLHACPWLAFPGWCNGTLAYWAHYIEDVVS